MHTHMPCNIQSVYKYQLHEGFLLHVSVFLDKRVCGGDYG